ncbi:glycoside hydrolase family 97 protein [Flaviramulus sp. BrNp1-15]|uniref:glycoside hydrolase family 97 protein n=1 Tax=Flaviramulus sp. BrNp1-15 TaxID=2916754 RepID=UPI001EE7BE78|nr:glycoside hydrolase family 97 protein [Flaviramulus sp. BrNp1-15]ULC58033.1 glycoside hydrolase family 97 protein [Flaviramulus sp. BrNp1-15]
MKTYTLLLLLIITMSCSKKQDDTFFENSDKTIKVNFELNSNNSPTYKVFYKNKTIIDSSLLGIIREDSNFYSNLEIIEITGPNPIKDDYTLFHGKRKNNSYRANQYVVHMQNETGILMDIIFNLSHDGFAFKYYFPETSSDIKKIIEEKTTYNFTSNTKAWLQPMAKAKTGWSNTNPSYEENYLMDINLDTKSPIGEGWVYPALFKNDSVWALVSETGLKENYCGTRLKYNNTEQALQVTFPQPEEVFPNGALNPESQTPWETPWRIIALGDLPTVTESTLGTDLADPAIDMDTNFVKGGLSSWSWVLLKDDFTNFETSKKFIDYANNMNWPYCLIDADWDRKIGYEKMHELTKYAKTKNVKVLVWYNSAGSWNTTPYTPKSKLITKDNRNTEFKKLNDIGVSGVKIDFFGGDGQSMIKYYHDILKDAAEYKLLVNFHGTTLPRGWQRTYPNLMTMESIKGEEFVTFVQENADLQPSHCTMLPFTRNVFDPMDFTPMALDTIPNITRKTTKAFELALPVLFTSGIQHIAEIPEGMQKQPDYIIDYLKDIPVDWDESKFVSGFPGKDVVMARRKGDTWFVVGINGENDEKNIALDLSFIKNKNGVLITDKDGNFNKIDINSNNLKTIKLQPHGGFVMTF